MEADRSAMEDGRGPAKYAGGSGLRRRRLLTAWLFMVPLLVINVLVILGPSVATIYYSLTEWAGIGPAEFVGLQNYRDLLVDGDFWMAMWHNVIWTVLFLTVPIFMGLLGAFLLSQIKRFQMFFRIVYFVPYVVASVVNAALWQNILSASRFSTGSPSSGTSASRCLRSPSSISGPGGASSSFCS